MHTPTCTEFHRELGVGEKIGWIVGGNSELGYVFDFFFFEIE